MSLLTLSFASGEDSLSVRRISIRERISSTFCADVEAASPSEDIDLDAIVGAPAELVIAQAQGGARATEGERRWTGLCSRMQQVRTEPGGLSTYRLRIEPALWLLTQRRNHRLFQHLSIPEIAERILSEWRIDAELRVDRAAHPRLELRTQYGESDLAFLNRLLEEAGISFYFLDDGRRQALVLHDQPWLTRPREGGPIRFLDDPSSALDEDYLTRVTLALEVRPGRYTLRDHDFRRAPELALLAEARDGAPHEAPLEQYDPAPGAFLVEGARADGATPVADDQGIARHDERAGKALAERALEAARGSRQVISFETNLLDLRPGAVLSMAGHPRAELSEERRLLVTALHIEGAHDQAWTVRGEAVLADRPYRPARLTPKPHVHSVQSAVVVGPRGEEIHTDEYGRVRVQLAWDRDGTYDERSSCWMRVSQGWAGVGYGMVSIPRVGQEVLVGFLDGDPDQPVVVGRLHNGTSPAPYKLPEHKAVSGWKTASSPGGEGYNELRFEDVKGSELVHLQAERNLTKHVKIDEYETTGSHRTIRVGKRLVLTTGEASIVLDGPNITIEAKAGLQVRSTEGSVVLEGGPKVVINPGPSMRRRKPTEEELAKAEAKIKRWRRKVGVGREPFWHGVEIHGTPEFRERARAALLSLAKTRMGRALLRKMARTGHVATVTETREMNGGCRAESPADTYRSEDGAPGKGSGSTVFFNPDFASPDQPREVVLGNGLVRAYQNARGLRETGETNGTRNDDLRAIGLAPYSIRGCTENNLRRNLGVRMRVEY